MEYSLNVKRSRMTVVVNAIDGGNSPGLIQLRDVDRLVLASFILQRPSFFLMGEKLVLTAPTTTFVIVQGEAVTGSICDGSGTIVIDQMTVGVDPTMNGEHDYEICLDQTLLELGKQVTIVTATIDHG